MSRSVEAGERIDVEYWEKVIAEIRRQRLRRRLLAMHESLQEEVKRVCEELRAQEIEERKKNKGKGEKEDEGYEGVNDFKLIRFTNAQSSSSGLGGESNEIRASELALLKEEEEKGLLEEEELMGIRDEVRVAGRDYTWAEKYRPRKPKYFNRVKTGFDWNLYNQTHYDKENPPPKTVQGYKFNIFYPDLLDATKAPKYVLEGTDEPEYAVLRFTAGAPYEDLAFKIVNQQWEVDKRAGFKCLFDRGVLQLHFNFKRHRYRR